MVLGNLENGVDPDDAQAAHAENGDHHGNEGRADAPKRAGGHVHHAECEIGQADEGQTGHAIGDGFRGVGDVNGEQRGAEDVDQRPKHQSHHRNAPQTDPQGLPHPAVLLRAGVLPDKIDGGLVERIETDIDEALKVACRRVAGHENITEGVYRRLDQHVGNGEQGALDARRQSDAENFRQLGLVKAQLVKV